MELPAGPATKVVAGWRNISSQGVNMLETSTFIVTKKIITVVWVRFVFDGRWRAFAGGGAGRALARRNIFFYPPLTFTEM